MAKLDVKEVKLVAQALATLEATLKRAVNTERDADVRAIREKQLNEVRALNAKCVNGSLDL